MTVGCNKTEHGISFYPDGAVRFHGHSGISPMVLAAEYEMLTDKTKASGCMLVAYALTRAKGEFIEDSHGYIVDGYVIHQSAKRIDREKRRVSGEIDPFHSSIKKRPSYILMEKARKALESIEFRSTPHVGHEVHIDVTRKITRIFGTKVKATLDKKRPKRTGHAMLDTWRSVIHAEISKAWVRVALLGCAVVENKFVYEIVKQRSKTDLRVRFAQQSRGYTISFYEGDIHKGSDGVWRIIESSCWPVPKHKNSMERLAAATK